MTVTTFNAADGCDIREMTPDTNYDGGLGDMFINPPLHYHDCGMESKEDEVSPLHHFDFSSIDGGDTISAAALFFYVTERIEGTALPMEEWQFCVYRCLRSAYNSDDWVTDEATWNAIRAGPVNWQTAGCKGALDRTNTNQAWYYGPEFSAAWFEIDVTDMVNDAHGEDQILNILNCGYLNIVGAEEYMHYRYTSYTADTNKPYLSITHEAAAPGGSRNWGTVMGSRLGLPSLPDGWLRRRGMILPEGC